MSTLLFPSIMILSKNIKHPKPYYKNAASSTLYLYITLILFLVSPLSVTAQFALYDSGQEPGSPLVALLLVIVAVFIIGIFIILVLCCKCDAGHRVRAQDGLVQRASKGLDPSAVESFPVFKYSEVAAYKDHSGPLECAVCLSPFDPDEKLRLVPNCSHIFHVDCLDPWLKANSTCALCRTDLVPETCELSRVESGHVHESAGEVNDLEVGRGDVEEGHIGKHRRCKSTGHVVGIQGVEEECWKRFTLMLPEKEMKKFKGTTSST